jgi:lysozyme family protein
MADSNISIQKTIKNEGGYQNIPEDTGNWLNGINYGTKWGITPHTLQAYFPALLSDPNCVRNLDMPTALSCYRQGYWKAHYSEINDQNLADKLFDMGVLFGVGTAVKMLQIALSTGIAVVPDGAFGPNTLAAVNERGNVDAYRVVLYNHAMDVVNRNPNDAAFLQGWTNRIQS